MFTGRSGSDFTNGRETFENDKHARTIRILLFIAVLLAIVLWPLTARVSSAATVFGIHVSSHRSEVGAGEAAAKYRVKGLEAFYRTEIVSGKGRWHRVYIGRYPSQAVAQKAAMALRNQGIIGVYFLRPIGSSASPVVSRSNCDQGRYFLHISSYKFIQDAKNNEIELMAKKINSMIARETIRGEGWFRVYLGPYANEKQARAKGRGYKAKGIIDYFKPIKCQQVGAAPKEKTQVKMTESQMPRKLHTPVKLAEAPKKLAQVKSSEIKKLKSEPIRKIQKDIAAGDVQQKKIVLPRPMIRKRQTRFSVSSQLGAYIIPGVNDFKVTRVSDDKTETWEVDGNSAIRLAVIPNMRITKRISLDAGFETMMSKDLSIQSLLVNPRFDFRLTDRIMGYAQAGLVYGKLDWKGVPGKFDYSLGLQTGAGIEYMVSRFTLGFDFLWRNQQFKYDNEGKSGLSSDSDIINLSGIGLSARLGFYF